MTHILVPAATSPRYDDLAYYLREYDSLVAGRLMRHQAVAVVREDRLVEFPRVLGPTESFPKASDIFIFGGFEETCGSLMDYADALREDRGLEDVLEQQEADSTLMKDYVDYIEMKRTFVRTHNRTVQANKSARS